MVPSAPIAGEDHIDRGTPFANFHLSVPLEFTA